MNLDRELAGGARAVTMGSRPGGREQAGPVACDPRGPTGGGGGPVSGSESRGAPDRPACDADPRLRAGAVDAEGVGSARGSRPRLRGSRSCPGGPRLPGVGSDRSWRLTFRTIEEPDKLAHARPVGSLKARYHRDARRRPEVRIVEVSGEPFGHLEGPGSAPCLHLPPPRQDLWQFPYDGGLRPELGARPAALTRDHE